MFFTGRAALFPCCVRDVTNLGAGIRLEGLNILPLEFDLSFDNFLTKTLPKVAAEMALSVLAYNLTRVMNIVGIKPLMAAIAA